jgi:DNA-binding response OmpR family regulator
MKRKEGRMSDTVKVLIVDDDEYFAESNRDLLEAYGYEVAIAHNGEDGIRLAREIVPDVMILDVMMTTDNEGFEVARKVAEAVELRQTAVLLVTGMERALDHVLEKPIAPDRLIHEVEKAVKKKRGETV